MCVFLISGEVFCLIKAFCDRNEKLLSHFSASEQLFARGFPARVSP